MRIGADLTPRQRRAVLEVEALHGSSPGTITLGGQRVRIAVGELAQEDPETETEAEAEGRLSNTLRIRKVQRPRCKVFVLLVYFSFIL